MQILVILGFVDRLLWPLIGPFVVHPDGGRPHSSYDFPEVFGLQTTPRLITRPEDVTTTKEYTEGKEEVTPPTFHCAPVTLTVAPM
jgi:hypothetical protein